MSHPPASKCRTPLRQKMAHHLEQTFFSVLKWARSSRQQQRRAAPRAARGGPLWGARDATAPTDAPPQLRALPLSAPSKRIGGGLSRALRVQFTLDSPPSICYNGGRGAGGADAAGAESPGAGARPVFKRAPAEGGEVPAIPGAGTQPPSAARPPWGDCTKLHVLCQKRRGTRRYCTKH